MRHIKILASILILILLFALPAAGWAGPEGIGPVAPRWGEGVPAELIFPAQPGKVVLVLMDRTSIGDLDNENLHHLNQLISGGAVGLVNSNTAGNNTPENTHATIGAGGPLLATGTSALSYSTADTVDGKPVADEYLRRTGHYPPADAVVQLAVARIHRINANTPYPSKPGALGQALVAAGLSTAVLGNSDNDQHPRRNGVLLAMDNQGVVTGGLVDDTLLTEDPHFPGGQRTDYDLMLQQFKQSYHDYDFIVLELGDLARIEDARDQFFDTVLARQRMVALQRIDTFLGQVLTVIEQEQDLLMIVAPTPGGQTLVQDNYLPPIILSGPGIQPGLLISPTTKRPGIIKSTDIAPTILTYYQLTQSAEFLGRAIRTLPGDNTVTALKTLQGELALTYKARPQMLKNYVLAQLVLIAVSLFFVFKHPASGVNVLKPFLLAVMSVPLALLLLPLLPPASLMTLVFQLLALTALLTWLTIVASRNKSLDPFLFICSATAILILTDIMLGSPLMKTSILGYDPIVGARFYGIGNEYMGILLGSVIIGTTALIHRGRGPRNLFLALTGFIFLFTLYAVASPALGTNVGGAIAGTGGFLVTMLMLLNIKITRRVLGLIGAGIAAVFLGLITYDLTRPMELQSHIGRQASLILADGPEEIGKIIYRKWEMNKKLIRYTIWSRVFLASLGALALLFYFPVGVMQSIREGYPDLYKGFIGVVVVSILAFLFNDSGVVAAATTMIFGAPPLIYLILAERRKEGVN